ncbi:hypothetical protein KPATCC21470_2222 [Kitasatospora purpeofusca]
MAALRRRAPGRAVTGHSRPPVGRMLSGDRTPGPVGRPA